MKKIISITVALFFAGHYIQAQPRGNSDDENPYEKIYTEVHPGKRTARCLKYLIPPDAGSFFSSPCNDLVEKGNIRIQQFEEFIKFFFSSEKDEKQMKAAEKNYAENISKEMIEKIDYHLGFVEKQGTFTSDDITPIENLICKAKSSLQSIKSIRAYLIGVKTIFPSTPKIEEAIQYGDEGLSKYADNKSIISSIKKNLGAALAEVYFPKAIIQNTEWENWFKAYFSKKYTGYVLLKQSLLTSDWYVKKNEISGLPEYRQMGIAIGAKGPDGKCSIIKIDLYQDYYSGKFNESRFKEFLREEILCENLK